MYRFNKLLQEREHFGRVWLASSGRDRFVLKDIPELIFEHFHNDIRPNLRDSLFIRLPVDTIHNERILVFKYMDEDLFSFFKKRVPLYTTKKILKDSLKGLAEAHSQDIVHLDIKPQNIMVNYHYDGEDMRLDKMQLTDFDNVAYLPNGRCVKGLIGNENWRSPEAFFKARASKPADVYSFGLVCLYAILGRVILGRDTDMVEHEAKGALPDMIRIQRQVSYFGTEDGVQGLRKHLRNDAVSVMCLDLFWADRHEPEIPYKHFAEWTEVKDELFKDLMMKMMNLDPAKRITAEEALGHEWFKDV